jgi:hypothetical protein
VARRVIADWGMPRKTSKKVGARRTSTMRARASSTRKGTRGASARGARSGAKRGASAHPIIDHEEIREWVEARGGHPAAVKATRGGRGKGDPGIIRIDFPGYSGARSLEPIDWDQWFEKFDDSGLALMVQDKTARGQKSNFNKLIKRSSAEGKAKGGRKRR